MKKYLIIFLGICLIQSACYAFGFKKKQKPVLFLSPISPQIELEKSGTIKSFDVFKKDNKIYFLIYTPFGFKSDYIKYQIVKQDDNAHEGGYSRVRAKNVRIKDKHTYSDYFTLSQTGKYYIQIFDIENLHQWRAFGGFRVVEE